MPLATNALTTLKAVKDYLEIEEEDTEQDEFLLQKINGLSDDIADYVRFNIADDYILPQNATEKIPRTLPYNLETACIELVVIAYQRKGSEHLKTEVVGPLRSDFAIDWPLHIQQTLDRYREYALI